MSEWAAVALGFLVGGALAVLALALLVSLPLLGVGALVVLARREWVPVTYNLRSLARRKLTTLSTLAAVTLVVFALTGVMMLAQGIANTLASTGNPHNVKILNRRASAEWLSSTPPDLLQRFGSLPGVAKDQSGTALVSGEMVVLVWAQRDQSNPDDGANLSVRGVYPVAFELHPLQLRDGRRFATGTREIIVGKALVGRFVGAELGGQMSFADREWTVVGIADHGGTAHDSEIWGDFEVMSSVFKHGPSGATLALEEQARLEDVSAALAGDPATSDWHAQREVDYWASLSGNYVEFVKLVGMVVGLIFSFGAILAALNTMYAQVAARTRELGTLRAIGFKPRAILVSLVFESVVLSLAGGALGVLLAALLQNSTFELGTEGTLSEITYAFHLDVTLALYALGFALLIGYAGGLLPAWRAARLPIVNAVRAD